MLCHPFNIQFDAILCSADAKKMGVAFMASVPREMLPTTIPRSRFGQEMNPCCDHPNLGPGTYGVDEVHIYLF